MKIFQNIIRLFSSKVSKYLLTAFLILSLFNAYSSNFFNENNQSILQIRPKDNLLMVNTFFSLWVSVLFIAFILIFIYINKVKHKQLNTVEEDKKIKKQIDDLKDELSKESNTLEFLQKKNEELANENKNIRKSEEKYQTLIKNSPIGILLIDKNGSIIEVNQALLDILGSPDDNKTKSFNLFEYQPVIDSGITHNLKKCFLADETITDDCLYFSNWGKRVYIRYSLVPIKLEGNKTSHVLGNIEDVTSRKNAEIKIKESEQKLREVNLAKDKFFSIIAHDIKTPFNAILGFSGLLQDDFDNFNNDEKKTFIKNINDAAEITFKLLENLLEWSRSQTGKIIINPEKIDLSLLINDTISFLKPTAEKKSIQIHSDVNYNTTVFADINMITTTIRNLISNAIKFSFPNGLIKISAKNIDNFIEISIIDNGIGISNEDLSKIFKLDAHFKKEGTAHEQGTGLGLILCKEFVEKNGGWIWAESEPGTGSSFKFTLPKEKS